MARRKCVCAKWTLVLLVVILCQLVHSRPQDISAPVISSTTNSVQTDKATESSIRYRYRQSNRLDSFKLPKVIGFVNNSSLDNKRETNIIPNNNSTSSKDLPYFTSDYNGNANKNSTSRRNRMITKIVSNLDRKNIRKRMPNRKVEKQKHRSEEIVSVTRKPVIRKVITKWSDRTKYEDLNFSHETSTSTEKERDTVTFSNSLEVDDYSSTENVLDESTPVEKKPYSSYPNKFYNKLDNNKYNQPTYESDEDNIGVVHSNKVHIIEYPFPSVRPTYIFTTPRPTPIITNIGNPKPWSLHNTNNKRPVSQPVRKKPLKGQYNYHNVINNAHYPGGTFEATTFQPSNAYTERIVIRPEEYSASNIDCPTIYLTLNNTFQGQGKEACPDLNIAVNTNVVNKNVVVETEEEDAESLFPGGFGLGSDSASAEDPAQNNDYFESEENYEEPESASVEATGLSYNHAPIQAESTETGGSGGSPSGALSGGKPGGSNSDDDTFSLSGLVSFFKPAMNALTWLAAISPFSFSIVSLMLTPLAMLIAGYSGVAALFAPLGFAREAPNPKIIHVYRPKWQWDDKYKTWYLNSFPENRNWKPPRIPRNSLENKSESDSVKPTLFYKLKEWMKNLTRRLRDKKAVKNIDPNVRKNKRRKRETWTRRVK